MRTRIMTIGPNMGVRVYNSAASTSRVLSGDGSDSRRNTITRRVRDGGGYVGAVYVRPVRVG